MLAGPYCTRLLADLGARVIKIERPGEGDEMRRSFIQLDPARTDQSTYFIRINAGKESVALDLAHPDARRVVHDLVRVADVVVENFLPGVVTRLGCDYAALSAIKPDLVYCSISGYGQTGPWRDRPAFAYIIAASSGIMHLEQQQAPAPQVGYLQTADVLAGTHAFGAIASALVRRARTGEGAYLDVSMLEALIAAEDITFGSVLNGGAEYPGPRAGMLVHPIEGRYLAVQFVGAPQLWPRLLRVMNRPELADDPRFATPLMRRERWPELRQIVVQWLMGFKTLEEARRTLAAARIPCAEVLSPAEVVASAHLTEREAFPAVPHPARGAVRVTATPFHVDGKALVPQGAAPHRVGEHTRAVLRGLLRYPPERIAALIAAGAAAAADSD